MAILVTYDTSEHVYTVRVEDGSVARTVEVDDVHVVDLDEQGRVLSIEVLDPETADLPRVAEQFGLEGKVAEMVAAVTAQVPTVAASTTASPTVWIPMAMPAGHIGAEPRSSSVNRPAPREIELVGNG